MNLQSGGVLFADSSDELPRAIRSVASSVESLGSSVMIAALVLAVAIILAALVGRYTSRRVTTKDPVPPHAILRGHTGDVISVAFSPDGKLLATASNDNVVKVWDLTRLDGLTLPRAMVDDKQPPSAGPVGFTDRRG